MTLPDDFDALLARLLTRTHDAKHVPSLTDPEVKKSLKEFPAAMDASQLLAQLQLADSDYDWSELDPLAIASRLIDACPEFDPLRSCEERLDPTALGSRIRWVWSRKLSIKNDRAVLGTTAIVSQSDRDLWPEGAGPAPWWKITLSLQAWFALSDEARVRLVHHEIAHVGVTVDDEGHTSPAINPHDIEENLTTIARFGLMDSSQGKIVAAAMAHPTTPTRQREWFVDAATGQGMLWPPPLGQDVIHSVAN